MYWIEKCLRDLPTDQDAGLNDVPTEAWKIGSLKQALLDVCNPTLNGVKPEIW